MWLHVLYYRVCVCERVSIYMYVSVCMHVVRVRVFNCVCGYICIGVCVNSCKCLHVYKCMHVYVKCVYMCMCMYA